MNHPWLVVGLVVTGSVAGTPAWPQDKSTLYDLVNKGRTCKSEAAELGGSIHCEYRVGNDLHIVIAAVGESSTGINFHRSNFDGDFWGSVAVMHGCVVVHPGPKRPKHVAPMDFAFISPKNGKVYRTWRECAAAS